MIFQLLRNFGHLQGLSPSCPRAWASRRWLFSSTGVFDPALNEATFKEMEKYWKQRLPDQVKDAQSRIQASKSGKPDFYVLSMFPYPSGQLHMGHVRVYAISDAIAHYYRMNGHKVLHPMGWDAFGLPAENAAVERGIEPEVWTRKNILSMRAQLDQLGCLFDWDREFATCDPEYYKWTQFIFTQMFKAGLAYQNEAMVNWDPIDKTVLADEQVDSEGRSWRSGAKVVKKPLRQWFLRTTQFSKDLYDGLFDPSLQNWRDIVKIQQNWIGDCDGTKFELKVTDADESFTEKVSVFTDRPELIFSANAIFVKPENILFKETRISEDIFCKTLNTGIKKLDLFAVNPFNGERLPVFVYNATEALPDIYPTGCDSCLITPESSEVNLSISNELGLKISKVIEDSSGGQKLKNSGDLNGLGVLEARSKVLEKAKELKIGGYLTSSKLNDWLISRQRYWGTPIPIIHCKNCGAVPVPEEDLPVELPKIDSAEFWSSREGQGEKSPLASVQSWVETSCPSCGGSASRETDTMDTFVDSSWYFFRYLDARNTKEPFSKAAAESMPVDVYIGGKEHATLHLYYARFITRFLNQIGLSPVKEPFINLLVQGMVKGQSFRIKGSGKYIPKSSVNFDSGSKPVERESGLPVVVEWEKMSKSKHNGADPGVVIDTYGSDMTRLLILSDVSPLSDRLWTPEDSYVRISNMLNRLSRLISLSITLQDKNSLPTLPPEDFAEKERKIWDSRNFYVRGVNNAYSHTRNLAMVMSRIQGLLGDLWGAPETVKRDSPEFQRALGSAIIMMAPLCPHICSELWAAFSSVKKKNCEEFNWAESVFHQEWPKLDPNYNLKLHITRNGKPVIDVPVAVWKFAEMTEQEAIDLACGVSEVQEGVLREEFTTLFEKVADYEATLNFRVSEHLSDAERKLRKEEKKREKERKKEERLQRIENYGKSKKKTSG